MAEGRTHDPRGLQRQCLDLVGRRPRLRERTENQILKFTQTGKFLMQIGRRGKSKGSLDTENFNNAADIYVSPKTNEVFVADGYVNRRVIVLDADTGKFKRMWGAYGNTPDDTAPNRLADEGPGPQQFNLVHGVRVSNDGLVYVADRMNNRMQVFSVDGKFQREIFVERKTKLLGTSFSVAFSPDPQQEYLYLADAGNGKVHIYERKTLRGSRQLRPHRPLCRRVRLPAQRQRGFEGKPVRGGGRQRPPRPEISEEVARRLQPSEPLA